MGLITGVIEGAVDSITQLFGGGAKNLYLSHNIQYALNTIQEQNWKLNLGYGFEVTQDGGGAETTANSYKQFKLQINPTAIEQPEPFGITIMPTQTGVTVEHQGFVVKDLTVSGTTGLQPFRRAGGVTGDINFGAGTGNSLIPSGVPILSGGKSGYLEAMQLRNYIRSYAEAKKYPGNNGLRLVFHNYKDNEHWYVEPVGNGITISRNAGRPFLYDYVITLKIVGKAGVSSKKRTGIFGQILNGIDDVENFINSITNSIDFAIGVFEGTADFLESIQRSVSIVVFSPLNAASEAIHAIKDSKNRISALPKNFYSDLRQNVNRLRDDVADTLGHGSTSYNNVTGRVAAPKKRDFLISDTLLFDAFNQTERALNRILGTDILFTPKAQEISPSVVSTNVQTAIAINQKANSIIRPDSLAGISAAFNNKLSFPQPPSVTEAVIEYGETIERFSARVLGDSTRYHEIILLNNLDPPYVSEVGILGKRTVTGGGRLLIPSAAPGDRTTAIRKNESPLTQNLNALERQLGVDLKLTAEADLSVNTTLPDLQLIAGLNNAAQALGIKVNLERGSLLLHPRIGTRIGIGNKNIQTVSEIASDVESSVLEDPRFMGVHEIGVQRQGTTILLKAVVTIKNLNKAVPLQLNAPSVQTI